MAEVGVAADRRRVARRAMLGLGVALTAALAMAANASAIGELHQIGTPPTACLWAQPLGFCAPGLATGDLPTGVAVTADNKFTYVVSSATDPQNATLTVLARTTTTGDLRQVGCYNATGAGGCQFTSGLGYSRALAISPDGKSVYVGASQMVRFSRNTTTGLLTPGGCYDGISNLCIEFGPVYSDITVSPDNKSVLGVTPYGHLDIVRRSTTDGSLSGWSCFAAVEPSCNAGHDLEQASGVAVSPDNKSVYVTGLRVTSFRRNTTTLALTQSAGNSGCLNLADQAGCSDAVSSFGGAGKVVVSKDNKSVYTTWAPGGVLTHFARVTTTGVLTLKGCFSDVGSPDQCVHTEGLSGAYAIAAVKDNTSVYVAGRDDDAIAGFTRNTTSGLLTPKDCTASARAGCSAGVAIHGPSALAISADNKSVYSTSPADLAVASFIRATSGTAKGRLSQREGTSAGCFSMSGSAGLCRPLATLDYPSVIALTKDAKTAYVASGHPLTLQSFTRNATTGQLTAGPCLRAVASGGCGASNLLAGGLSASSVVSTPDNTSVYAAVYRYPNPTEIAIYKRNTTTGALTAVGCAAATAVDGCITVPGIDDGAVLATSANSKSIYVASAFGRSVTVLARTASTSKLAFVQCLSQTGGGGCAASPKLGQVSQVTTSPDGKSVYVGSPGHVVAFARNTTTGALTYSACVGTGSGCTAARVADDPISLTVSPDNKSVYVGNFGGGTDGEGIAVFKRNTTTGALSQPTGAAGCVQADAALGCAVGQLVGEPRAVHVSPDNKSLYAATETGIAVYSRSTISATLGNLSVNSCVADASAAGPCVPSIGLGFVFDLAVSANNKNVYSASPPSDTIDLFVRKTT